MIQRIWNNVLRARLRSSPRPRPADLGRHQLLECRILLAYDLTSQPLPGATSTTAVAATIDFELAASSLADLSHSVAARAPLVVTFPDQIRVGQLAARLIVTDADAEAELVDGWIDWNGDGNYGGAAEHAVVRVPINAGDNTLNIDIPAGARPGTTTAHFVITTSAGLDDNHAVQEYSLQILPPLYPSGQFGLANPIDAAAPTAFTVAAADLDHDGDLDILSATLGDGSVAWYENDGSQNFMRHLVAADSTKMSWVVPIDLDQDGDLDVVASSQGTGSIFWYENDGHQNFTERTITTSEPAIDEFSAADIDGDGDLDIVSSAKSSDTVAWYENAGSGGFIRHIVTTTADLVCSVSAADLDGDGDMDLVSASFYDNTVAWYENDGRQGFTKRVINTTAKGARAVVIADLDGDGDQDIVGTSFYDNTIAWYQNDGHGNFNKLTVSSTVKNPIGVFAADMDGDGDLDIVAAARGSNTIAWFENVNGTRFPQHTISTTDQGAHGVVAADVNGDGRLDVVSASQFGNRIAWYENLPNTDPVTAVLDASGPAVLNQSLFAATATFNSAVVGFSADSLTVQNGRIANFLGSGTSYTFDVVPTQEGTVTVTLGAGAATNALGAGNSPAVLTREFTSVVPEIRLSGGAATVVPNGIPTSVVPYLTVVGSRVGGGRLQVVIDSSSNNRRNSRYEVLASITQPLRFTGQAKATAYSRGRLLEYLRARERTDRCDGRRKVRQVYLYFISRFTTLPLTSVKRKSRPAWRYVKRVWSMPIKCRIVA